MITATHFCDFEYLSRTVSADFRHVQHWCRSMVPFHSFAPSFQSTSDNYSPTPETFFKATERRRFWKAQRTSRKYQKCQRFETSTAHHSFFSLKSLKTPLKLHENTAFDSNTKGVICVTTERRCAYRYRIIRRQKTMKTSKAPIRNIGRGKNPWELDLRYVGGKREYYRTKALAETRRENILHEVANYGQQALSLSYADRVEYFRVQSELKQIGSTLSDCLAFFKKHHTSITPTSFCEAIEKLIYAKRATNKDDEYTRKLELHLNSLRIACGKRLVSEVTVEDIEKWLYGKRRAQATIRNLQIDVRTFFNFCEKRHWIVKNPVSQLEKVKDDCQSAPGILTPEKCGLLLSVALRHMKPFLPYLTLTLLCGLRPEEAVKLQRENVNVDRGFVEVPAYRGTVKISKSRRRRLVEMSNSAKAWFSVHPVITPVSSKWYARRIIKLRTLAEKLSATPFPWPKNCLRHSYASYRLAQTESADKTALELGHSTDVLLSVYRELASRDDAQKFFSLMPDCATRLIKPT